MLIFFQKGASKFQSVIFQDKFDILTLTQTPFLSLSIYICMYVCSYKHLCLWVVYGLSLIKDEAVN